MASIIEKLADRVNDRGITMAYGQVVQVDGVDVAPVALVTYGFGGGGDNEENGGGGGGGGVIPLGAYIGGPDGVRFRPNPIVLLVASIPVIATAGWVLVRLAKLLR